jgi:hypothetical protein
MSGPLTNSNAYSGFSSNDIPAARRSYADTLGIDVTEENGMLTLRLGSGAGVLVYPKDDHEPATFTVLSFPVADIEGAVDQLRAAGVAMAAFDGIETDDRDINRDEGPLIAWFRDPARGPGGRSRS